MQKLKPNHVRALFQNGSRYFELFSNDVPELVPNVSTVMRKTMSPERKLEIANYVKENPDFRKHAARGTAIHHYIKRCCQNQLRPVVEAEHLPWKENADAILKEIGDKYLIEGFVWSKTHKYAGVVDLVGEFRGEPCLIDWKAKYEVRKEFYDEKIQLAAYYAAIQETYGSQVAALKRVVLIDILPAPLENQIHVLSTDELKDNFAVFLDKLKLFREMESISPTAGKKKIKQQ